MGGENTRKERKEKNGEHSHGPSRLEDSADYHPLTNISHLLTFISAEQQ